MAGTYYFSDCQTGAVAGCVPGNNANAGTSASAPKRDLTGFGYNALPAGTRLLFARGGAWANFAITLQNPNATATSPIEFDSYATAWGGSAAPIIRPGSAVPITVTFGAYNDMSQDGGYAFRNLKFDGNNLAGSWAFLLRNNTRNITIENNELTNFEIAVHTASPPAPQPGNVGLTIRNNNIHHNSEMGMLGDATDMVIEGNTFAYNNYSGSTFNHAIYLGGRGRNGIVRNNTFTNNSVVNGVCYGGNFTVHGQWDGLLFENNVIEQTASNGGCYGVSINSSYDSVEFFRNVVVRANRIINLGNCAICLTSAPGAIVENNLIVNTQATYQAGILIPDRTPGPGDDVDGGAVIRNNTIYMSRASAYAEGIQLTTASGTNMRVVSNLIYFGNGNNSTHYCYRTPARSYFAAFDNNLCYHASGVGAWTAVYSTFSAAQAAGFDVNGRSIDPLFVALPSAANGWSDDLQLLSPARGTGHLTLSSTLDRLGVTRLVPNIGSR